MNIDLGQFRGAFLEEAAEHVASIEAGLLGLESDPADEELINCVFRAAHSIKGGSSAVGLTDVARFTHVLEGLLDRVRDHHIAFTRELGTLLLQSNDVLRQLLVAAQTNASAPDETDVLLERLSAVLADGSSAPAATAPTPAEACSGARRLSVRFLPGRELLHQGLDPVLLIRDLIELDESCQIHPELSGLPALSELDPELCYLGWTIELTSDRSDDEIRDLFAFAEDCSEIEILDLSAPASTSSAPSVAAESRDLPDSDATGSVPVGVSRAGRAAVAESSSIRVATEKVDRLVDLVGELVITQSMVSQAVRDFTEEKLVGLQEAVAEMERNTRELQERVMAVRMMPIGSVFSRFPRLVRDLAASFGKTIALRMSGEETELDKSVVERIGDPLTHLVRNAVDHGIESSEVRRTTGKPEEGTIGLRAFHAGGSVIVEVTDDGGGLNLPRVREKAIDKGLLGADAVVSDDQIAALIFEPGFSTAEKVTDVSGRGVGMDVVKRNVEELNGSVSVHTEHGRGTRFRIRLPLTLAILDGMTMSVGDEVYILPLTTIVESLRPSAESLRTVLGRGEVVALRGEYVPLLRLHSMFGTATQVTDPTRGLVIIVENEGNRLGILVDEILGQAQVVIKTLEHNFRKVDGIMGATILGDGRVALILDVAGLTRLQPMRGPSPGVSAVLPDEIDAAAL